MNSLPGKHILRRGFTIIELIIVVTVIGILASVSLVAYNGITQRAISNTVVADLESLAAIQTQYALKNETGGKQWYSVSGVDPDLRFSPSSSETVIDVVVNNTDYCMRAFNPSSVYVDLTSAAVKGSGGNACDMLPPSLLASGVLATPANIQASYNATTFAVDISWNIVNDADSYRLEHSPNSDMSGATTVNNITATTYSITSAIPPGYYIRVSSIAGAEVSLPTPVVNVPVFVFPP